MIVIFLLIVTVAFLFLRDMYECVTHIPGGKVLMALTAVLLFVFAYAIWYYSKLMYTAYEIV